MFNNHNYRIDMGEIIDKVKEKAKDVKDEVVDTTKGVAGKTKDTVTQSSSSSTNQDRRYEEGGPGTEIGRGDNPLTDYREKEPMTPAKINEHEPTAVKRDPNDQRITEPGQTGTDSEKAREELRKRGMTQVNNSATETNGKETT
jgi:hypothetical protein